MSILLDTNVLLGRVQPSHPSQAFAVDSVARLFATGEAVHFTLQNIAGFRNVATRPAEHNGLGFPAPLALVEVEKVGRRSTSSRIRHQSTRPGAIWF